MSMPEPYLLRVLKYQQQPTATALYMLCAVDGSDVRSATSSSILCDFFYAKHNKAKNMLLTKEISNSHVKFGLGLENI